MSQRGTIRWVAALIVALACAVLPNDTALAHPEIVSTEPAADAQLDTAPGQVTVRFNEPVEAAFAGLQVFNAQSQPVDNGDGGRSPSDPSLLTVTLPPLPAGIYTVVWQVVGSDGHTVTGYFVFSASGPTPTPEAASTGLEAVTPLPVPTVVAPPPPIAAPTMTPPPPLAWVALLRALMLLGALVCVGGWVLTLGILHPALSKAAGTTLDAVDRRWRLVTWGSIVVLVFATAAFLLTHTQAVAGRVDMETLRTVLIETRLGQALLARTLLALGLLGLLLIPALERWRFELTMLLGSSLLFTFSISGHAAAQTGARLFAALLADWAHLAATALWVGGLVHLALLLPTVLKRLDLRARVQVLAQVIARFSTLAFASVVILAASGTYTALQHVSSVEQLWTTRYGQALLVKLALFGVLLVLGGYNMLIVRPRFVDWATKIAASALTARWSGRFQWAVRGEVMLALVVLGAVGVMTSVAPPRMQAQTPSSTPVAAAIPLVPVTQVTPLTPRPTRTPAPIVPFAAEQPAGDLRVGLEVQPAGIGKNTFIVSVCDTAGEQLDVQRVQITLDMSTMEMGETQVIATPDEEGRYVVVDQWLSMVGEWNVSVLVRRIDADDVETTFLVPVGG